MQEYLNFFSSLNILLNVVYCECVMHSELCQTTILCYYRQFFKKESFAKIPDEIFYVLKIDTECYC